MCFTLLYYPYSLTQSHPVPYRLDGDTEFSVSIRVDDWSGACPSLHDHRAAELARSQLEPQYQVCISRREGRNLLRLRASESNPMLRTFWWLPVFAERKLSLLHPRRPSLNGLSSVIRQHSQPQSRHPQTLAFELFPALAFLYTPGMFFSSLLLKLPLTHPQGLNLKVISLERPPKKPSRLSVCLGVYNCELSFQHFHKLSKR